MVSGRLDSWTGADSALLSRLIGVRRRPVRKRSPKVTYEIADVENCIPPAYYNQ